MLYPGFRFAGSRLRIYVQLMSHSSLKLTLDAMRTLGLRDRTSQVDMMNAVVDAIQQEKILCVEAPTGTGKTLAYSLATLSAKKDNQILLISTATTALQEQFLEKDLLLLEKILNKKLNVIVSKGRRRYVCHSRLLNPEQHLGLDPDDIDLKKIQKLLTQKKWQGDVDKLPIKISSELWQQISTDASGCSAGRCEYFNDCVFHQNRRRMPYADIVVTNHSLLLSDLELGGGVVLPAIEESIYVLDECHHLPEKALSHFAKQAALLRSLDWINNMGPVITKAAAHTKLKEQTVDDLHDYIKHLVEELRKVKKFLDVHETEFQEKQWRLKTLDARLSDMTQQIIFNANKIFIILQNVLNLLDAAYEMAVNKDKEKADAITHVQSSINFLIDRCDNLVATWRDLLELNDVSGKPPMACWFEKADTRDLLDYTLHTSPINVSAAMKTLFWEKLKNAAVMCSATVRAMGEFNDFLRKLGLNADPRVQMLALNSPFEHQHSILFVPRMQHEPSQFNQDKHLDEMLNMLPSLILPNCGNLVLFTSRKAMRYVYDKLPEEMKSNVLLQDDHNKMDLIALHQVHVDANKTSIIFGLASFAEGIDLPGRYCQHVIIQKIPFSVPSDPISLTRADWLKKHRGDPFQLITLPETSIKLAQYVGRLLRHEDDRGIVTILDKRLYSKFYGKALLANLPAFTPLVNCSVEDFLANVDSMHFIS